MAFRLSFVLSVIVMFTFNITEFECSKKKVSNNNNNNNSLSIMTEFPLGISDVFDDASDVFRKIIGKMISKKKLVGLENGWYW